VLYNKIVPITESALLVLDAQDSFKAETAGHAATVLASDAFPFGIVRRLVNQGMAIMQRSGSVRI
jgi:hypothetical protein